MAAVVALECGWIVTEVGRQPWIVYNVMRTSDAVTQASGIWVTFGLIVGLYVALGATLVIVAAGDVAALAQRGRRGRRRGRTARTRARRRTSRPEAAG